MSGKFMTVKRLVIPTITALIIASQLVGCAGAKESELLQMINNQQAIEIEVATPEDKIKASESFDWIELASLSTYQDFRDTVDDTLMVTALGAGGKNGTIYVDLDGNHTNNSTLYYALMNKKFRDQMDNTDTRRKLLDAAKLIYADVKNDNEALVAFYNAYFRILEDQDNRFNSDDTVTRAEFLGGLYRAENPVRSLVPDTNFVNAVDDTGKNVDTVFASQLKDISYLTTNDKSLNNLTFNSTITRGEAIYTLIQKYYADEYNAVSGNEDCFSDAKNAGNEKIAEKQGFIEISKDKSTKETIKNYKDYWKSYELQYAIQNVDKGCPETIYRALVVAKNKGLITSDTCRWDEGLTRGEFINFIVKIYKNKDAITNADRGISSSQIASKLNNIEILDDGHLNIPDETYSELKKTSFFSGADNVLIEAGLRYYKDNSLIDLKSGYDANALADFIQSFDSSENVKDLENSLKELGYIDATDEEIEANKEAAETAGVQETQETKPVETKPVETKPAETKPVETKPAETKPAETKPVETKPVETKPVETKPAETKPAETKPAETQAPVQETQAPTQAAETGDKGYLTEEEVKQRESGGSDGFVDGTAGIVERDGPRIRVDEIGGFDESKRIY